MLCLISCIACLYGVFGVGVEYCSTSTAQVNVPLLASMSKQPLRYKTKFAVVYLFADQRGMLSVQSVSCHVFTIRLNSEI